MPTSGCHGHQEHIECTDTLRGKTLMGIKLNDSEFFESNSRSSGSAVPPHFLFDGSSLVTSQATSETKTTYFYKAYYLLFWV